MRQGAKVFMTLFAILILCTTAKPQLSVSVQLRNRAEGRDGYKQLPIEDSNPAYFISQRSRLGLGYSSEALKLKLTAQDVRVWGDDLKVGLTGTGDQVTLGLFEGYAEIRIIPELWMSIGRQQLIYDKEWIFATRNWNQNGISYDALLLKFNLPALDIHVGSTWNAMTEASQNNYYPPERYKTLNFVWIQAKPVSSLKYSLFHLAAGSTTGEADNTLRFRHTSGLTADYLNHNFNAWTSFYFQSGKNKAGIPVRALLWDINATYMADKFTPGLGLVYLSGNSETGHLSKRDRLFDLHYGARHRYLGCMDYFTDIPGSTQQGGVVDISGFLDFKFSKKTEIRNTLHHFQLAESNELTPDEKYLGIENDLVLKSRFNSWATLEVGYMIMLPGSTMKTIQNRPDSDLAQFAYMQLTILPDNLIHQ